MVGHVRRNRASRHAVEFRGLGRLYQTHAALRPDLLQAVGAVAAGSGEHDGDGPFAPVGGQRAKQHIDRMAMAPGFRRLGHVKPAVAEFSARYRERSHRHGWTQLASHPRPAPPASLCGWPECAPSRFRAADRDAARPRMRNHCRRASHRRNGRAPRCRRPTRRCRRSRRVASPSRRHGLARQALLPPGFHGLAPPWLETLSRIGLLPLRFASPETQPELLYSPRGWGNNTLASPMVLLSVRDMR